jgi:glycopeptide antibiotics resistance protein
MSVQSHEASTRWFNNALVWLMVAGTLLFFVSLSPDIERATSPHIFGLQVILRKSYSIVAFGVVGFLLAQVRRSRFNDIFPVALLLALYSTAIELTQFALGSQEGTYWNFVDILCGFLGGYLGATAYVIYAARQKPPSP